MGPVNVYIVEDSVTISSAIKDMVEELGYRCMGISETGEEALERIHALRPDIVLMDIWLKGEMNGIEVAYQIYFRSEIPVIFMTASTDLTLIKRAKDSFGSSYLVKPINLTELYFNIEMALSRTEAAKQLKTEKYWRDAILEGIIDGVVAEDSEGSIIFMNGPAKKLLEAGGDYLGHKILDYLKFYDPENGVEKSYLQIDRKTECRIITRSNQEYDVLMKMESIDVPPRGHIGKVVTFTNISDEKRVQDKIRYLTFHDQLTGLYNRNFLEEEYLRLNVSRQHPISFIMADLNGLKQINDIAGHEEGDQVLKNCAAVLKESCRDEDIIARIGGDEFLIILPLTNELEAKIVLDRIRLNSQGHMTKIGSLSLATGLYTKTDVAETVHETIAKADEQMYANKIEMKITFNDDILSYLFKKANQSRIEGPFVSNRVLSYLVEMCHEDLIFKTHLPLLKPLVEIYDIGMICLEEKYQESHVYSEYEKETMRRHSDMSCKIAQLSEHYGLVAQAVLSHHERWDGMGYPLRLKGEQIPFLARMLAVVDSYVAMTETHSYRHKMTQKEAFTEIGKGAGNQFDPVCVNMFFNALIRLGEISEKM